MKRRKKNGWTHNEANPKILNASTLYKDMGFGTLTNELFTIKEQ